MRYPPSHQKRTIFHFLAIDGLPTHIYMAQFWSQLDVGKCQQVQPKQVRNT